MRNNQPVTPVELILRDNQSPISRTDTAGNITYVNADFVEASGFSEDELLGQPHNIVRHPDMPPEAYADLWRDLKAGQSWTGMVKNRRKNGDYYWVLANASPIVERGQIIGYSSVRMKAPRERIAPTAAVYQRFRTGQAGGLRIEHGQVRRSGLPGLFDRLRKPGIRGRLRALMVLAVLMIGVTGWYGLAGMSATNASVQTLYREGARAILELDHVARLHLRGQLAVSSALVQNRPGALAGQVAEIESIQQQLSNAWAAYQAIGHTADEKKIQDEFQALLARYRSEGLKPTLDALRKGDMVQAESLQNSLVEPLFAAVNTNLEAQLAQQDAIARMAMQQTDGHYLLVRNTALAAMFGATVLLLLLGWRQQRGIVEPINQAVTIARQIAAGNLALDIDHAGSDEIGQLMNALYAMQHSLASMAETVRQSAQAVSQEAVDISHSNEALATRTQEQSSALEEAASNMEQVSTTVKNNIDNAQAANTLAQDAGTIASHGGTAMGQVVGTMDSIAASSRKVSDIIGVINGIAFQTNILALNAAVEAARAGEQGRGFAVVASEVRNLAQRSAAAAKEIKTLIEGSVQQVQNGLTQVGDARKTIESSIEAVQRVAALMSEISHSSSEQGIAIDRVAQLVVQLDAATRQNVPMVLAAAEVANKLAEQGHNLVRSADVFRLP